MHMEDQEVNKWVAEQMTKAFGKLFFEADEERYILQVLGKRHEAELYEHLAKKYEALNMVASPTEYFFCGFKRVEDFGPRNAIAVLNRGIKKYGEHHAFQWEIEVQTEIWENQQAVRMTAKPEEGAVMRVKEEK